MNKKRKKKSIAFSLLIATGMLLFANQPVQAQDKPGGLLGYGGDTEDYSFFGRGGALFSWAIDEEDFGLFPCAIDEEDFGANEGDINVEDFGTPVGNGVLILLATGIGYATMKKKESNNIKNIKKETKS